MPISTKTAAKLAQMAQQSAAVADALYDEDDLQQASDAVAAASRLLAAASQQIEERAARYVAAVNALEPNT